MSDAGNGEAQIALLRNEPYGVYCRRDSVRHFRIASANQTQRTRSACSTCLPRIVTSSNVSSEFAVLKTTANIKSAALRTAVNIQHLNMANSSNKLMRMS